MNSNTQTVTALRRTALNPNAKEFVPTSLRSSSSFTTDAAPEETKLLATAESVKTSLERTDSSNSCASDEECRRYWHAQLPDDILTPDFDFLGQSMEEKFESSPSVTSASGFDCFTTPSDPANANDSLMRDLQYKGTRSILRHQQIVSQASAYSLSGNDYIPEAYVRAGPVRQVWEHQHALPLGRIPSSGNFNGQILSSRNSMNYLSDIVEKRLTLEENGSIDPVTLLAGEFPGFATQSLAEVYEANGGDLNSTVEMLTQLKLQEDGSSRRHVSPQLSSTPNMKSLDFPGLSTPELVNRLSQYLEDADAQRPADVATAARKNVAPWQYDRNGAAEFPLGSSRFPLGFNNSNGDSRVSHDERFEHFHYAHRSHRLPSQNWLETGEAVGSIYSELREEARDHARVRNAYFEQISNFDASSCHLARQAYIMGNKALAKEANARGQLHNRLMKAAHSKAGEIVFQQRNLATAQVPGFGPGQPRLLDLHGLHVNDAIALLKRELSALRVAARSSRQRQQVFICVGTGHNTKGSRTSGRLPLAVERYLAEEERLHFTEPQPGMIKVVLS